MGAAASGMQKDLQLMLVLFQIMQKSRDVRHVQILASAICDVTDLVALKLLYFCKLAMFGRLSDRLDSHAPVNDHNGS